MKKIITLAALLAMVGAGVAWAQEEASPNPPGTAAAPARRGGGGRGRADPHIVSPGPTPGNHPPDAPMLPYHFVAKPMPPDGQKFGNVSGVALTARNHLIIFDRNPSLMMAEYDEKGKFVRSFNPNIAVNTHGLRIDSHGNIWALDSFLNVVWKLNAKGEPLMMVGTRGEVGKWDDTKWNGMFNQPMDIAFDKDDNFYVVQGHGGTSAPPDCTFCNTYGKTPIPVTQGSDPRVFKFDKTGKYITSRALPHADGTYPTIHSVIFTPKGELWVTDRQLGKIMVFDTNLNPIREMSEPNLTSGLFVDAKGHYWMSSGMDGMIMSLDENGKITGWIGKGGRSQDDSTDLIGEAHYLVVTPDEKTIYIADSVNGKVLKLEHN
jgi:DNA-binding beta-propeller fold protein YncE